MGLKADKLKKLLDKDIIWEDANNAILSPLVEDGTLTESEKKDLLVTADLTRLTGNNLELIKVLKTPKLKTLEEFISWNKKDWVKLIKNNKNNDGEYTSGAMLSLASISLSLDKYDEAVNRYKEAKTKFTDSAIVNESDIMIAICYRIKGDTVTAIKAFEDYLKAHPNSPDTGYVIKQIDKLKNPPPREEGE